MVGGREEEGGRSSEMKGVCFEGLSRPSLRPRLFPPWASQPETAGGAWRGSSATDPGSKGEQKETHGGVAAMMGRVLNDWGLRVRRGDGRQGYDAPPLFSPGLAVPPATLRALPRPSVTTPRFSSPTWMSAPFSVEGSRTTHGRRALCGPRGPRAMARDRTPLVPPSARARLAAKESRVGGLGGARRPSQRPGEHADDG